MSADSPPSRGSLLGLPGELRNRIYRLVVVFSDRDHQIRISPENHSQPALLKSNRQIRKETTKIFEKENVFNCLVHDTKPITPSDHHWIWRSSFTFYVPVGPKMVWSNLKQWVKDNFENQVDSVGPRNAIRKETKVIAKAFELSHRMSELDRNVSWAAVDAVLEIWKETLHVMDPDFWWDGGDETAWLLCRWERNIERRASWLLGGREQVYFRSDRLQETLLNRIFPRTPKAGACHDTLGDSSAHQQTQ